ncbi:4'-phosphopantetheinyl transferase family protein [Streptomyces meridianus]|uniref:4'-phosphopantetheinyl transferase superfamily protein n=1 Tax=Streptomyces meridianus TaxID=2938945 RepID=A0ABT0XE09_9ACTN|nr:4'-phosphopantetheinyl transferase superfamily protein [Streptomyces meridianus]MCM2580188.1 4'-phosphopantetheinyl transferase superfamily protein [Streptomyces meridianus]
MSHDLAGGSLPPPFRQLRAVGAPFPEQPQLWALSVSAYPLRPVDDGILDPAERQRAARFVRPADRDRYRVAHVGLRRLLGAYLAAAPERIELTREPCPGCGRGHGRPAVAGAPLHFSLSHAGDLVVFAVADAPVGVDVEEVPSPEALSGLTGALHPVESAELDALPADARPGAFARCWTRKEAFLKGTGLGLGGEPAGVCVGAGPEPLAPAGWHLTDVAVAEGYAAACAVRHPDS